jgi:hypothetical protein
MGLFDTFIVPGASCVKCGNEYDANFQTKVFNSLMDVIKVGEDVRTRKPQWWLFRDNICDRKFTLAKAKRIVARKPKKFKLSTDTLEGNFDYVRVDKYFGSRPPNFSNIKEAEFELHDICPKCKKYYEVTGIIKKWKFVGIRFNRGKYTRTVIVSRRPAKG